MLSHSTLVKHIPNIKLLLMTTKNIYQIECERFFWLLNQLKEISDSVRKLIDLS